MKLISFKKIRYRSYLRLGLLRLAPLQGKKRVLFIMNPKSGEKIRRLINSQGLKVLRHRLLSMDVLETQYAGHAPEIVEKNFDQYDIFVAVGGDGTANEVAGKLIGTNKIFSILPSGSGNGCARELGFPPIGIKLMRLLVKGETKKMDVLYINDKHSINVSGTGYDATIAKRFQRRESRGIFNYLILILRSFFFYKPQHYCFNIDGRSIETDAFLISFANTRQFGNNAFIAPNAKHDDGIIDVVVVKPFPKWYAIRLAYLIMTKKTDRSGYVTTYRGTKVTFEWEGYHWFHIDGDPYRIKGPVTITIKPMALKVFDTGKK